MKNILITTIYKGTAVIQAIKSFSPDKIYFVVDEPIDETRKSAIGMIKDLFPDIEYEQIPGKIYDIVAISKEVINIIDKEKGNKITVHISEGRKTMSLGLLFGAYVKRSLVNSAYYITEETNTLIKLPLVELKLSKQKNVLLEKISKGKINIGELEKELKIKASTLYVHLKELRDEGYLGQDNKLTEMGKIVLLNNSK